MARRKTVTEKRYYALFNLDTTKYLRLHDYDSGSYGHDAFNKFFDDSFECPKLGPVRVFDSRSDAFKFILDTVVCTAIKRKDMPKYIGMFIGKLGDRDLEAEFLNKKTFTLVSNISAIRKLGKEKEFLAWLQDVAPEKFVYDHRGTSFPMNLCLIDIVEWDVRRNAPVEDKESESLL